MKATTNNTTIRNTSRTLATLLAIFSLAGTFTTIHADSEFAAGRLLIKMRSSTGTMRSANPLPGIASLRALDPTAATIRSADAATWFVADLEAGTDVTTALNALADRHEIEFVEPDYIARVPESDEDMATGDTMSDPGAGDQYALTKIHAEQAWQVNGGSHAVIVALVDTGVQLDHPDLQAQMWHNTAETLNGIDDDGNGMIDDIEGWNFFSNTNDPSDDHNHGTHVAGIIAAVRDNQLGVAGAADVTLMPVKVLGSDKSGPVSGVIEGIRYAMNNGADVINLSLSIPEASQAFEDIVNEAAQRNIVVVAAAGNEGVDTVSFPAAFDNVIAVGATNQNDDLANFSNAGPGIELVAPGVGILSTIRDSQYGAMDGTSMATPYVSAVAALIRSAEPNLTAAQIRDRLDATADDLGDNGYDTFFGNGRINAARALGASDPTSPSTPNNGNDDSFEDNNTHETAKAIQPGQFALVCNDDDWFTMPAPGYFAVEIDGSEGDLDLFVFEADGTLIGSSESDSSSEFVEGFSNSGTIFIAVSPYEGQTGAYTLFIDGDGSDSIDNNTPGDTFGNDPLNTPEDLGGISFDPTDGTLVVPVTCGVGAVQMMAAMLVGCVGLGAASRRKRTRRSRR